MLVIPRCVDVAIAPRCVGGAIALYGGDFIHPSAQVKKSKHTPTMNAK
jgi:hypothetical protein